MSGAQLLQTFSASGSFGALWTQYAVFIAVVVLLIGALTELPRVVEWARSTPPCAGALAALVLAGGMLRWGVPAAQMDIHYRLRPAEAPIEVAQSMYGLGFPSVVRALWAVTGASDAAVH